jgi:hypothetical protein
MSVLVVQSEPKSIKMLKESFEEFMNKDNRTAAYIAMYVDELMKSGLKGVQENEADDKMEQVPACCLHTAHCSFTCYLTYAWV